MHYTHTQRYGGFYRRVSAPWRHGARRTVLLTADRVLVAAFALAYVGVLLWLLARHDASTVAYVVVPAVTLVIVSLMRRAVNEPRPSQSCRIDPLVQKSQTGMSFPSRHVSSACIIACALASIWMPVGVVAWICAGVLGYARIAEGVHYPRDIVCGVLIAAVCGFIGFVVL